MSFGKKNKKNLRTVKEKYIPSSEEVIEFWKKRVITAMHDGFRTWNIKMVGKRKLVPDNRDVKNVQKVSENHKNGNPR